MPPMNEPITTAFIVPDGMPASVFRDKYARRKDDGSFETWEECATRTVIGNLSLRPDNFEDIYEQQRDDLLRLAVKGVVPFSGRHLQHGDADQRHKLAELFVNCTSSMFSWTSFLLLMKGCGVGRDYSSDMCYVDWDYLPNCRFVLAGPDKLGKGGHPDYQDWIESLDEAKHKYDPEGERVRWFEVGDSAEGWARVVMIMETAAFHKHNADTIFVFDFSKVRRRGAPLRGQQNRPASGPVPFIRALLQVMSIKGAGMKPWKQAMFVDHYLAGCVVVGGVRRAARDAVKSCHDRDVIEFIDIKRGGYLWSANNSILSDTQFWEKAQSPKPSHDRRVYEAAAGSAYWDDTGEPGFFNVDLVNDDSRNLGDVTTETYLSAAFVDRMGGLHARTSEMIEYHLNRAKLKRYRYIPNPCVTADTFILTARGPRKVRDLIGTPFTAIVDGKGYGASGFWKTGNKPIMKITTERGYEIRLTGNHQVKVERRRRKKYGSGAGYNIDSEWVRADELHVGDQVILHDHRGFHWDGPGSFDEGWLLGEMVGDGGYNPPNYRGYVRFWGDNRKEMAERALTAALALPQPSAPIPLHKYKSTDITTTVMCTALNNLADGLITAKTKILNLEAISAKGSGFVCGFLRGLFDADGTVLLSEKKGRSIRLAQSDLSRLHDVQFLLHCIGIASTVYPDRLPARTNILPDGHGGMAPYQSKAGHELVITRGNMVTFMQRVGFYDDKKSEKGNLCIDTLSRCGAYRESFTSKVSSVEPDGTEPVYDCCVAEIHAFDANGIMAHNCFEIPLAIWGAYCDIGDLCLANTTNLEEVITAARRLAEALVRVNTMTCMYEAETRRTNRIGVSLTGIHEFLWRAWALSFRQAINPSDPVAYEFWMFIGEVRRAVEEAADEESVRCGLPTPATYTCIKPSGTISKVMGCTEGAHLPAKRHYVRWVAFQHGSSEVRRYEAAGYPVKDVSHQYRDTVVVGFPTCLPIVNEIPDGLLVTASEATPEEQFAWLRLLEKHWLGDDRRNGQVSYTLKWQKSQVGFEDYLAMVLREQPTVRCCAMMPELEQDGSAYAYLPEEPVTKAEYDALVARIAAVRLEAYDAEALACEGGACPIERDIHDSSIGVGVAK